MEPSQYHLTETEDIFNLLVFDYTTILNLCQTSTAINNICQNDDFWQQKFTKDFKDFDKLSNETWRESYNIMNQIDKFLSYIIYENKFLIYELTVIINNIKLLDFRDDEPIRVILFHNKYDNTFHLEYDLIEKYIEYADKVAGRDIKNQAYHFLNESIISEHDCIELIYSLLALNIKPNIEQ